MNYLDFIIIYLACGSPFGVYHYLNNRQTSNNTLLSSLLTTVFWVPYAFRLLQRYVTKRLNNNSKENEIEVSSMNESELFSYQKHFEDFLPSNSDKLSLFELRETIERYVGLTFAVKYENKKPAKHEEEIYKISNKKNTEISAICLNRINRLKLKQHQNQARIDFIKLLKILFEISSKQKKLGKHSLEFVRILKDSESQNLIETIIENFSQTIPNSNVNITENDLWKKKQPQPTKQIPLRLKTLTVTANSQKKD